MSAQATPLGGDLMALFQAGRHREVVQQAQALSIQPSSQPLLACVLAGSLFRLGQFSEALPLLEQLDAALGLDVDYLSLYGATCRRLGQVARAEALFARAIALRPDDAKVRNNYANLLIDVGRVSEAEAILRSLLESDPDYQDARANLNRIQFRQQPAPPASSAPAAGQPSSGSWTPLDPLLLAFADEEVAQAGAVNLKPAVARSADALIGRLPEPQQAAIAKDQIEIAQKAIQEGNPAFALQLCGEVLRSIGCTQPVYVNASDAYIRLKQFHEAEICLLTGIALGGATVNHYINLVSLASMRGDLLLADHYLDAAGSIDPGNPTLQQLRQQLEVRRQQLKGKPFQFALAWQVPQLNAKPAS